RCTRPRSFCFSLILRRPPSPTLFPYTTLFRSEIIYQAPEGITLATPKPTEIKVSGIDPQAVGQAAAEIRSYRPPEPYKGKGVRYAGEYIRRKEGKKK